MSGKMSGKILTRFGGPETKSGDPKIQCAGRQGQKIQCTLGKFPEKIQKNSRAKKTSLFSVLLCQKNVAGVPEHFCWIFGHLLGFDSGCFFGFFGRVRVRIGFGYARMGFGQAQIGFGQAQIKFGQAQIGFGMGSATPG